MSSASAGQKQAAPALNSQDKTFIQKATQGGMAEVKLGKLASEKGTSAPTRSFGEHMVQDHSAANEKLSRIVKDLGVMAPMDVNSKQKAFYKKIQGLSGAAFDKAYGKMMVQDHHETIALFQKEAQSGHASRLKQFATETLPTLKEHLTMTKGLSK